VWYNFSMRKWLTPWAFLIRVVSVVLMASGGQASPAMAESAERLVLAFYYTWFDERTWTPDQVPDFPLEPYASRDPAVMRRHIEQAKQAGIDAFVVSWYGPQVESNQTETNFATMLNEAAAQDFRLAIDFEVRSPFYRSQDDVIRALQYLIQHHAQHPAYLRWQGKPVIFFWRNASVFRAEGQSALAAWQYIRAQVDPNHHTLWIAEGVDISFLEVFDGHHLYTVTWNPPTDPARTAIKFSRLVREAAERLGQPKLWVATVMPGWDSTRAGRGDGFVRSREDGAYYAYTWQAALASMPDWVIITSFNEWREGTYIEPSQAYGDRYLRLTAEWSARFKSGEIPALTVPPIAVATSPPRPRPTPTPLPTPRPLPKRWQKLLEG
jgi:hypothetical protein